MSKKNTSAYFIRITKRDGLGQVNDDFHAKVTRIADGAELIYIGRFRKVLEWRTRRAALDRAYKYYDKRQKKMAEVKEIRR